MFFSPSTGGFYLREIHGDNIPADAVEITTEQHAALMVGQSQGKRIVADANGYPQLQDPPTPTLAQQQATAWEAIKAKREALSDGGGYKVVVGGVDKWFHSDAKSKTQQLSLFIMGASVPAVQWKTMDGSFITMTQAIAAAIFQAAANQDASIFAVAESHKAAMEASADPASYDFSTGWPATFGG